MGVSVKDIAVIPLTEVRREKLLWQPAAAAAAAGVHLHSATTSHHLFSNCKSLLGNLLLTSQPA